MRSSKWANNAGGRFRRRTLGMLIAVESAGNLFLQSLNFSRVAGVNHAFGEFSQLLAAHLPALLQFAHKINHDRLFLLRQVLDLVNDLCGSHAVSLRHFLAHGNACRTRYVLTPSLSCRRSPSKPPSPHRAAYACREATPDRRVAVLRPVMG